jgi:hypothetical protein
MALKDFRPTNARKYEAVPSYLTWGQDTITANTTTRYAWGAQPANSRAFINALSAAAYTVPADSDGTVLATVYKYDASADSAVTLTSALDLEALTAKEGSAFTITSTLTDEQRTLDAGDFLYVEIVNNSAAINTAAVGLRFTAEVFALS